MKILLLDNYDSFTYNLAYLLRSHCDLDVIRNDKIEAEQCGKYDGIILSPGPGVPKDAGNLMSILQSCAGSIPILGICLGHQAIAEHCGNSLINLADVHHGTQSMVTISNTSALFKNVPEQITAGRYHSWAVQNTEVNGLSVIANSDDGCIMAVENTSLNLYGIQFHPESILTPKGETMIHNFLSIVKTSSK